MHRIRMLIGDCFDNPAQGHLHTVYEHDFEHLPPPEDDGDYNISDDEAYV